MQIALLTSGTNLEVNMTPEQIEQWGPAFAASLQQFLFCCSYTQTFDLLQLYCRGLLSDLKRKICEPLALYAGVAVRTLQEFLKDHVWSVDQVRDRLQQHVVPTLAAQPDDGLGTLGLIDETGTRKKGTKTPGVQRQGCGERGKTDNCIVTVHLGLARGRYKTLIDGDLFLPKAWDEDRDRCRQAGIPDDCHYRPKWQIALEQLDRARANDVTFDWLTFDEGYGGKPGFLQGLGQRHLCYVGEVPQSFRCHAPQARSRRASRADDLVRHSPLFTRQPWRRLRLERQTGGDQQGEVKAARVQLALGGQRRYWLIWARNVRTGEEKYFVSNASARTSLRRLLRVAFSRWNVEHAIRLSQSEIGFRHFEGRNYVALLRRRTLCQVTLTFVAGQAERLRGEKCRGDDGASVRGAEPAVQRRVGDTAGDEWAGVQVGSHPLSPAA
jgi:SRSO17 transposase